MRTDDFDLVVVGAGIIGATVARLASVYRPQWRILTVDRGAIGAATSRLSAGLDVPLVRNARQRELVRLGRALAPTISTPGAGLPATRLDAYWIVEEDHVDDLVLKVSDETLRPASRREREDLVAVFGGLRLSESETVLRSRGSSYGSPHALIHAMMRDYSSPTRLCWEGTHVETFARADDGVTLTCADGRVIRSDRLVVAPGPWLTSGNWAGSAGLGDVRLKKVAALQVEVPPRPGSPVLMFFDHDAFLLPRDDERRWLLSFASDDWDCPLDTSRLSIDGADRGKALAVLDRYVPAFTEHAGGGRVFCDAYTPDRTPLVAPLEDTAGVLVGGASGSGYRFAPGIAQQALESVGCSSGIGGPSVHGEER